MSRKILLTQHDINTFVNNYVIVGIGIDFSKYVRVDPSRRESISGC